MADTQKPGTGNKQKTLYSKKHVWVTNKITRKLLRSNQYPNNTNIVTNMKTKYFNNIKTMHMHNKYEY